MSKRKLDEREVRWNAVKPQFDRVFGRTRQPGGHWLRWGRGESDFGRCSSRLGGPLPRCGILNMGSRMKDSGQSNPRRKAGAREDLRVVSRLKSAHEGAACDENADCSHEQDDHRDSDSVKCGNVDGFGRPVNRGHLVPRKAAEQIGCAVAILARSDWRSISTILS